MSSIKGKHICFTGKMEKGDRDDMKAQAKDLGANYTKFSEFKNRNLGMRCKCCT